MSKKPVLLCILDGYGMPETTAGNAIAAANKPNLDALFAHCPHTTIDASGMAVGLPDGQMGNSEVGHTNIGAGRVVFQDLPRISLAVKDGSFFQNEAYLKAVANCKQHDSALHIFGLLGEPFSAALAFVPLWRVVALRYADTAAVWMHLGLRFVK